MIPLPNSPKVSQKKDNYARIEIDPFYPGYGTTIGNSFRRVLYSSLQGAAITEVKINGVNHEFSTIPGVIEDVLVVLLNLKQIRFKLFSDEPQTIELKVSGEKKVKASDFKKNPEVEIINPDLHIATLSDKKSEFVVEAKVERGIGYSIVEEREERNKEAEIIEIDAVFTPVKKVNMKIEHVIVGKRTDFEKVILDIETDGTLDPEEAFLRSSKILQDHYSVFSGFEEEKKEEPEEKKEEKGDDTKKLKVEDLNFSDRTKNALITASIKTVAGLVRKTEKDLLDLDGFGNASLKEVSDFLKKNNLEFKV